MQLRPYQTKAVDDLRRSYGAGKKAPLLVLPTGGGKTFCFTYLADKAAQKGNRAIVLVHRQELLMQTSRSLDVLGVGHGLISPQFRENPTVPVQVASVQTLRGRIKRSHYRPDLIIIDEAHHATAGSWRAILDAFPGAKVLGVTATPIRADGTGLDEVFDDIVLGPSMAELIADGYLVEPEIIGSPVEPDLKGVRKSKGDYNQKELAERTNKPAIVGSAVDHYRKFCRGLPAIVFCVSVEHAETVAADFRSAGFRFKRLDGTMPDAERKQAIDDLANGRLDGLTSCDIISEGTDIPVVGAAIQLRATDSLALNLQQLGRALRPIYAPGYDLSTREGRLAAIAASIKPKAIILDQVGNWRRHGFPQDDREWTLEGMDKKRRGSSEDDGPAVKQCEKCFAVFRPAPCCPKCGHIPAIKERKVEVVEGELVKITPEMKAAAALERKKEISGARTREQLLEVARRRGYNPLWVDRIINSRGGRAA